MTTLHEAARLALEALKLARRSQGTMLMSDPPQEAWKANRVDSALLNAIEALRSALWQQDDLANASKSEQLLASRNHALRAEFQRTKAALSQQGEPVAWMVTTEKQDGTRETYPMVGRYKDVKDVCDFGEPIPLYAGAAPAAQPIPLAATCHCACVVKDNRVVELCKIHSKLAAPAAQPLTRAQIDALADDGAFLGNVYEITRAIELHHGIGADK